MKPFGKSSIQKLLFIILLWTLCSHTVTALAAAQTPEKFVREFYTWYCKAEKSIGFPASSDEIYTYADKKLVKYVRTNFLRVEYFIKLGDGGVCGKSGKIITQKAIPMADDVYVVPVIFRDDGRDRHVIVYVKKTADSFSIIKVSDIYPYS